MNMAFSIQKYTVNSFRFTSVEDDSEVVAIACSLTWLVYRGTTGEHFKMRTSHFSSVNYTVLTTGKSLF